MPARDGTNKILRAALPALTTTCNIHLFYGQSNSDGTNGLMLANTSDPSMGAAGFFGQDGRKSRDNGTTLVWTDLSYPPAILDFSTLPNNTIDEPCRAFYTETPLAQVAKVLNARQIKATGQRHFMRLATFGQTGYTIARLIKGQNAYTNFINGVTKMIACAIAQGYTPIIRSVTYIQGEADFATSGSGYAATLAALQANIETDLKAITSQSQAIPMFLSQQSNFSNNLASGIAYPVLDQLAAHVANPGKIILAAPMYQGETDGVNASAGDLHYRGHQGIRWHAALGNAIATVIIDGTTWNPVMPKVVSRSGAVITVQFYVPVGPLVLDTSYVTNTTDGFYGFDFHQTGGTTTLQSVSQTASDTLQFTLSGAPDGTNPFLRAGRNSSGAITSVAGFRTGARTCLRDSADPDPRFCNYCVHFDQPIT